MKKLRIIIYLAAVLAIVFSWYGLHQPPENSQLDTNIKVALREVGNSLLLELQDSTSLIKPVIDLGEHRYELSFERSLIIPPDKLVRLIDSSLQKAQLPDHYITEVVRCDDQEVAYSYRMEGPVENTLVPCLSRELPEHCYTVVLQFFPSEIAESEISYWPLALLLLVLLIAGFDLMQSFRNKNSTARKEGEAMKLGIFHFYPEENKLVKEATEISLSKKECELLSIFIQQPNKVVKRDDLSKQVWEDHGVIVGRSLDTYISKLRKILKEDPSLKLTNVHGVGYKLEIDSL